MPLLFSRPAFRKAPAPDLHSNQQHQTTGISRIYCPRNPPHWPGFPQGFVAGVSILALGLAMFLPGETLAAKTTANQGLNATLTVTGTKPVPLRSARQAAMELLMAKFHTKFKKDTPTNSESFATTLVDQFESDASRPALQYAALQLAMKLAANAGDSRLGLSAVQAILNEYRANPYQLASEFFKVFSQSPNQIHPRRTFTILRTLEDKALTKNNFTNAAALAMDGIAMRRQNGWIRIGRHQKKMLDRALLGMQAWNFYQPLPAYLKSHPNNVGANLGAAAFFAAVHNDWHAVEKYLSAAKIPQQKKMETLAQNTSVSGHLTLGDMWWKLAAKGGSHGSTLVKLAAGDQYAAAIEGLPKALPALLSGMTRQQINKLFRQIRTAAQRTTNLPARRLAMLFISGLRPAQQLYRQYISAKKGLEKGRKSGRREFAIGVYTCFIKADWNKGLSYLAKSNDRFIARVSNADISNPTKAARLIALGQAWLRVARQYPGFMRYNISRHALGCFLAVPRGKLNTDQRKAISAMQSRFDQGIF